MVDFRYFLNKQGPKGAQGEKGDQGFSPSISVGTNTANEFTLQITNEFNTFETPNLRGSQIENQGGTYVRYNQSTGSMYAGNPDYATEEAYGMVKIADDLSISTGASDVVVTAEQLQDAIESVTVDIPKVNNGVLTLTDGTNVLGTFSANQSTNVTITTSTATDPNNGILTIQKNGVTVGTFGADSSTNTTVNITVPSKVSDLSDGGSLVTTTQLSGILNSYVKSTALADVAITGSYNDLIDKPDAPTIEIDTTLSTTSTNPVQNKVITSELDGIHVVINDATTTISQHTASISSIDNTVSGLTTDVNTLTELVGDNSTDISSLQNAMTGKVDSSSLSTVATSGSYNDLIDKPTIPEGVTINDTTTSTTSVWSSTKTNEQIQNGDMAVIETVSEGFLGNDSITAGSGVSITTTTETQTTAASTVEVTKLTVSAEAQTPTNMVTLDTAQTFSNAAIKHVVGDILKFHATSQNPSFYNNYYMRVYSPEQGTGVISWINNGSESSKIRLSRVTQNNLTNNFNLVSIGPSSLLIGEDSLVNRPYTITKTGDDLLIASQTHLYGYQQLRISTTDITFTPAGSTEAISLLPSGGGSGDVTAAGDNTFTGSNTFSNSVNLNGGFQLSNGTKTSSVYLNAADNVKFNDNLQVNNIVIDGQTDSSETAGIKITTQGADEWVLSQNSVTAGNNITVEKVGKGIKISGTGSSSGASIDDTTTTQTSVWSSYKVNETLQAEDAAVLKTVQENFLATDNLVAGSGVNISTTTITETTGTSTIITSQLTINSAEQYGLMADYAVKHGITSCPNGIIDYSATSRDIVIKQGLTLNCAGNGTAQSIISSDTTTNLTTETGTITLFYANGSFLECGQVDYSTLEPTENGVSNYQAWFNPDKVANPNQQWQFKSNDTGNIWRAVNSATPIATIVLSSSGVTSINHLGFRVLNKEIYALRREYLPDYSAGITTNITTSTGPDTTIFTAPDDGYIELYFHASSSETLVGRLFLVLKQPDNSTLRLGLAPYYSIGNSSVATQFLPITKGSQLTTDGRIIAGDASIIYYPFRS